MKILIVQLGRIGDMILATPMFSAIKRKYPDAETSVLASVTNNSILRNNPNVDNIFILDKIPHKLIPLLTQIRSKQFDYLIDAKDHRSTESGLIARIVKAGKKIGFNPPGKSYFTDGLDGEKDNTGLHFVLRSFKPLSYLGISMPDDIPHPELFPVEESMKYVANFLNGANGKPVLTINLSASNHGKMWENDNWKIFIEAIDKQSFFPIITYAPADSDVATDLLTKVKVAEFNSRNMDDVIALISQSSVLVTPDTSLIHVAAAFDKPLFGLFSGLNDFLAKFHPLSSVYEVVRSPEGIDGIKAISSEQSIEGFNKLIDRLA